MQGLSVATTADLNSALGQMESKFDEHRKWTEGHITDFIMKLRNHTERLDNAEREQQSAIETIATDVKAVRAGTVNNTTFRQQVNAIEKRFDHENEEHLGRLENLRMALEKEITTNISNLRLKAETLNANCIQLTEKSKAMEETLLPAIKADFEEQKQKRLCETQRLESEIEKMKELCESKISHTAAALRFYVTATATKLREETAPLTQAKELEEDLKQKEADLKKLVKACEEEASNLKEQLAKHKGEFESSVEKHTADIGQHTKALKVCEITVTNLQRSIAADLNDMREEIRSDRSKLQVEITDARTTAMRSAASNENSIQAVASEIAPLRSLKEQIFERLHIEKIVQTVRDWQTSVIPQVTATAKDVEERLRKVNLQTSKDHETLCELQKSISEVRRHFKMFHAIASGLDDKPHPGLPDPVAPPVQPVAEDTRLPPISARNLATSASGASPANRTPKGSFSGTHPAAPVGTYSSDRVVPPPGAPRSPLTY